MGVEGCVIRNADGTGLLRAFKITPGRNQEGQIPSSGFGKHRFWKDEQKAYGPAENATVESLSRTRRSPHEVLYIILGPEYFNEVKVYSREPRDNFERTLHRLCSRQCHCGQNTWLDCADHAREWQLGTDVYERVMQEQRDNEGEVVDDNAGPLRAPPAEETIAESDAAVPDDLDDRGDNDAAGQGIVSTMPMESAEGGDGSEGVDRNNVQHMEVEPTSLSTYEQSRLSQDKDYAPRILCEALDKNDVTSATKVLELYDSPESLVTRPIIKGLEALGCLPPGFQEVLDLPNLYPDESQLEPDLKECPYSRKVVYLMDRLSKCGTMEHLSARDRLLRRSLKIFPQMRLKGLVDEQFRLVNGREHKIKDFEREMLFHYTTDLCRSETSSHMLQGLLRPAERLCDWKVAVLAVLQRMKQLHCACRERNVYPFADQFGSDRVGFAFFNFVVSDWHVDLEEVFLTMTELPTHDYVKDVMIFALGCRGNLRDRQEFLDFMQVVGFPQEFIFECDDHLSNIRWNDYMDGHGFPDINDSSVGALAEMVLRDDEHDWAPYDNNIYCDMSLDPSPTRPVLSYQ